VVAFGAGVFLCVAGVGFALLLQRMHSHAFDRNDWVRFFSTLVILFVLPAAVASYVAVYSHPFHKPVLITALVPALFVFLVGYLFDIKDQIETSARHAMTGGMLGYTSPFNVIGQAVKISPFLLWAGLVSALALLIKRLFVNEDAQAREEREGESFSSLFVWGLIALTVAGLVGYYIVVSFQNTPSARVASARKILHSQQSTESERRRAIYDLWHLKANGVNEVLRAATKEQPYPLNVMAASFLAWKNDISGLPLLETHLRQSSKLKGAHFDMNLASLLRGLKDPEAVPAMSRLLKADDPKTREGAVQALRNIGGDEVIDPLVEGLSDSDAQVRWICAMALTEIVKPGPTEALPFPGSDQFEAHEELYIDAWKKWAAERARP